MNKDAWGLLVSYLYFFMILLIPQMFPKVEKEYLRKFVHIMIGNWWFILLHFFSNVYIALIVPVSFIIISYCSIKRKKKNGLLSFYIRPSDGGKAYGIVLYPIALVILIIISYIVYDNHYIGGVGIIAMSFGDGIAAIIGKTWPRGEYVIGNNKKTVSGSLSMLLVVSILLTLYLIFLVKYPLNKMVWTVLTIAGIATIVEAITPRGLDNLTVPISSVGLYIICNTLG